MGGSLRWLSSLAQRACLRFVPLAARRVPSAILRLMLGVRGKALLVLLSVRAGDVRDLRRRSAGLFGDLAVLLDQEPVCWLVAVNAARQRARHLAGRALRAVFVRRH